MVVRICSPQNASNTSKVHTSIYDQGQDALLHTKNLQLKTEINWKVIPELPLGSTASMQHLILSAGVLCHAPATAFVSPQVEELLLP